MGRHLSIEEKQTIIYLHIRGFKNSFISQQFAVHRNVVSKIINNYRKNKFPKIKKRNRIKKLSAQQVLKVLNFFLDHPFSSFKDCIRSLKLAVCSKTISNLLKLNGIKTYSACFKQFLTIQNQINRLKFAIKYQNLDWSMVSFLDEKIIQTYSNGHQKVKRKINERYNFDKLVTIETQNSKNKVNLVGIVSFNGPNMVYSVSTILKGDEFKQLIEKKIINNLNGTTLLMDNAKIHNKGIRFLLDSKIPILIDFPPKSNDINIIENVWAQLQKNLNKKLLHVNVSTKDELLVLIKKSWIEIPPEFIRNCILSMPDRLKEIIRLKGKQTRF